MIKTQDEIREVVKDLIPKQDAVAKEIGLNKYYFNKWLKGHAVISSKSLDKVITWIHSKQK